MALKAGDKLGSFEILTAIGTGGFGAVYKARDTRLNRTVAIKVLSEQITNNPEARQRFEREAQTIAGLKHPNICVLHDVGRQDGTDFLVMEYIEGETLANRLTRGSLPLDQALKVATEIADALDKAHRQGITHRDLKPGNIMLTKSGSKLLDFGLAKLKSSPSPDMQSSNMPTGGAADLTAQGTILGTLQYMSPEQLEGIEADARSDIFAFGAVLYEMLTGRKAFEGRSQASLMAAILEHEPPAIAPLQPMTPPMLERIVKTCLAKDPDNRWQTARDLRRELGWIADGEPQSAVPERANARPTPDFRSLGIAVTITALTMLAIAGLAVRQFLRQANSPEMRFEITTPPATSPYQIAISPDGRKLIYEAEGPDHKPMLFVRALDSTAAQPLRGTEDSYQPFWSPDSRYVAFDVISEGKVKKVDVNGGPAQTICDYPAGDNFGWKGSWNSDGVIILGSSTGLYRVPESGGIPSQITTPDKTRGEIGHYWPQFLPDGRHFLYLAWSSQTENRVIYAGSLDSKTTQRVMAAESMPIYESAGLLLFQHQGTLLAQPFDAKRLTMSGEPVRLAEDVAYNPLTGRAAFDISSNGVLVYRGGGAGSAAAATRQLVWLDRSGNAAGKPMNVNASDPHGPELSPDEGRAAVDRTVNGNRDVWLIDLKGGDYKRTRFTFDPAADGLPVWSADGSQIAFESNRKGNFDIYIKPASGAGQEHPLLELPGDQWPYGFSKDGKYLLYYDGSNAGDLWALPLTGDNRKPMAVATTPYAESNGALSPDGRWAAYQTKESGRFEIVVQPFPEATGKWQVSANGGVYPRWRADGRELYFVSLDNKMMAAPVTVSGPTFSAGTPAALFPVRILVGSAAPQYAVSRDGRFLINQTTEDAATPPITVVLNWNPPGK